MENSVEAVEFKRGKRLWSWEGYDSNAIILPNKKKKKEKGANQDFKRIDINSKPKLSRYQKKTFKKLEEKKEKSLELSKIIESLKKNNLSEDAFLQIIAQAKAKKQKRRRSSMRNYDDSAVDGTEPEIDEIPSTEDFSEDDLVQPMIVEREALKNAPVSLDSSQGPIRDNKFGINGGLVAALPAEEVLYESYGTSKRENNNQDSSPDLCVDDVRKSTKSMDTVDESQKADFSRMNNSQVFPAERPLTARTVVHVSRPTEVENARKDLPAIMMEQEIMEAINGDSTKHCHSTVIICGETGCGKTTQVPQFLYEAGFGSRQSSSTSGIIGVTQPRRVAVLATAKRVAYELGLHLGEEVGYQVRYDKSFGENCSIKFMTDGILLREVQNDFLLRRYSVIILDEAHERSLNTDILIGMLSRVIKIRKNEYEKQQQMVLSGQSIRTEDMIFPLKFVLMSATLQVEDFKSGRRLFADPPRVIEIESRQFPVTVHNSKKTDINVDYIRLAYKKVMAIHKRLPRGSILVFVTGKREIEQLCQKLRKASKELIKKLSEENTGNDGTEVSEMNSVEEINVKEINEAFEIHGNSIDQHTDRFSSYEKDESDVDDEGDSDVSYNSETDSSDLEFFGDDEDPLQRETQKGDCNLVDVLGEDGSVASLKASFEALAGKPALNSNSDGTVKKNRGENGLCAGALCVLPLHAKLSAADQFRVFKEVKEGERLVVVATNVAETSLTIPGIKYVVDTGKEKVKSYNFSTGMETYDVKWISKASADQRKGRAGRTGPGHCYRLYTAAAFGKMDKFSLPEISKIPVDGVVLFMKSMGIDKVSNFPFPTPPEANALVEAEHCLKALEALDSNGKLTPLGQAMARYPMSPRHSRMLLTVIQNMGKVKTYARANLVLGYAVAAAAALSLQNPFVMQYEGSRANKEGLQQDEKSGTVDSKKVIDKQEKLRRKELKETAKVSRAKFSNPSSDALTIAYALQCFELSKTPAEFCDEHVLHLKTMEEMSKLRRQLLKEIFNQSGTKNDFSWIHGTLKDVERAWRVSSKNPPLVLNEEEILGQAICAGWSDRVAKRVRGVSRLSEGDTKAHSVRYQACVVKENVFLHRWSSVSSSTPEFLVYSGLLLTKRPYMYGVTSVKSEWLVKYAGSLCTFSAALTDPKPYYEPQTDEVFCYVLPTFGPHLWELPLYSLPITNDVQRVAVFACALLEGKVLPCLRSVREFMAAPPSSILRPEASGQKRVGNLLNKLKTKLIDSCAMLREAWKENPKELHSEILGWFQESFHKHFEALWSQMLTDVSLKPQERFPQEGKRGKKKKYSFV